MSIVEVGREFVKNVDFCRVDCVFVEGVIVDGYDYWVGCEGRGG